jgi:hypothetical protein
MRSPLAFIELFVVLAFAIAWGILELVARRLDTKRHGPEDGEMPAEPRKAGGEAPEDSPKQ